MRRSAGARAAMGISMGLLLVLTTMSAEAEPSASPTLTIRTTIADHETPRALASEASWASQAGVWTVTLRTFAPPGGETTASSRWRSANITVKPHQVFFASDIATEHQGVSDRTVRFVEKLRVCYVGGACERGWSSMGANQMPQAYTDGFPFVVSSEQGVTAYWTGKAPTKRIYVQWRFELSQTRGDEQTTTVSIAAGRAAQSVDDRWHGKAG